MFHIKLVWVWLKENWKIPFLIIWSVVIWVLSRKNAEVALEVLKTKKESYEKQVVVLKENHKRELSERDKLVKQYHDTIEKLEVEFANRAKILTKANKQRVKEIIEQTNGDPDAVREKIERLFDLHDSD